MQVGKHSIQHPQQAQTKHRNHREPGVDILAPYRDDHTIKYRDLSRRNQSIESHTAAVKPIEPQSFCQHGQYCQHRISADRKPDLRLQIIFYDLINNHIPGYWQQIHHDPGYIMPKHRPIQEQLLHIRDADHPQRHHGKHDDYIDIESFPGSLVERIHDKDHNDHHRDR